MQSIQYIQTYTPNRWDESPEMEIGERLTMVKAGSRIWYRWSSVNLHTESKALKAGVWASKLGSEQPRVTKMQ